GSFGALRVSIGPSTGEAEIELFSKALGVIAARRAGSDKAA
ncbi:MAG: cysteine desulfurase, partial [Proteobacteria bacterium]